MKADGAFRFGSRALGALWLLVVPALLALIFVRKALPSPLSATAPEAVRVLATNPFSTGVALFVLFSLVIRGWLEHLPGARFFSARMAPPEARGAFHRERRSQGWKRAPLAWALALGALALAGVLVRSRVVQAYRVESSSMLPTLRAGTIVAASRLEYRPFGSEAARTPERGDVIVFERGDTPGDEVVKRVIGLPGDHLSFRDGFPSINGWEVPHCDAGRYAEVGPTGVTDGRLVVEFLGSRSYLTVYTAFSRAADDYDVKAGEVFVLGDNRNQSSDSRFWVGNKPEGLPIARVSGRIVRLLSLSRRDQTPTLDGFLQPFELTPNVIGVDVRSLRIGIETCVRGRPKSTEPPARSVALAG
jgi:signal peptidase I